MLPLLFDPSFSVRVAGGFGVFVACFFLPTKSVPLLQHYFSQRSFLPLAFRNRLFTEVRRDLAVWQVAAAPTGSFPRVP